ncbi:MAG: hypothetical protein C0453_16205 [Comamonadaceae bacterium]|nr:hypothetical protein [Comamonadaceae bacterium]
MKAVFPQRFQSDDPAWDKSPAVVTPETGTPTAQSSAVAASAKPGQGSGKPPHPPSGIHKELMKLFRRL